MGTSISYHTGSTVSSPPGLLLTGVGRFPSLARVKKLAHGHHEWISLSASVGANYLVVENLQSENTYQFSVLSQNKLGSGPFSEIVEASPLSK